MIDLENDERAKRLNELIQQETDPVKMSQLVQQLLDLLDEKKSEAKTLS